MYVKSLRVYVGDHKNLMLDLNIIPHGPKREMPFPKFPKIARTIKNSIIDTHREKG